MMYRQDYVLAIVAGGKIANESDSGEVALPFGTEYKVRLKNKSRVRALADIYMNGEPAAMGIVLEANQTVNVERYLKGDLNAGPKFLLERLSHPGVSEPNDTQNGLVEVKFYKEKSCPKIEYIPSPYPVYPQSVWPGICPPWRKSPDITWCSTGGGAGGSSMGVGGVVSQSDSGVQAESRSCFTSRVHQKSVLRSAGPSKAEAASTVEGSKSCQSFTYVTFDPDLTTGVTLAIKLKGYTLIKAKCSCGRQARGAKYCPDCGEKLRN